MRERSKSGQFRMGEVTQKLDLALEQLQEANARQHRARERLGSDPPPREEVELEAALEAGIATRQDPESGSGPRKVVVCDP